MSEWIKHDGKGMPVNGDEKVLVKFKDGKNGYFQFKPSRARIWGKGWLHLGRNYDITEYCVVEE